MEDKSVLLNNNIKMRYLESKADPTSDRHILFIHGLGSSADRWLDIPDALSKYYHTIAVEFAIRNKELIEKLVLIDSSGFLKGPTPLLEQYLYAAKYTSYDNVRSVFEQLVSQPWRVLPAVINTFITRINSPGAKYAFESAYKNSTTTQIDLSRLKSIEDIPTLIIWGKNDNLIPIEHIDLFKQVLKKHKVEKIEDAGHAPFAEKPAIICEILLAFLSQNN